MNPSNAADLPAEEMARLMDTHGIEPEYRDAFQKAMNWAAFKYSLTKGVLGAGKAKTELLARKARMLVKAVNGFEEARRSFGGLSETPIQGLVDITLHRNVRSPGELQTCRDLVKADAERWRDAAEQVYDEVSAALDAKDVLNGNKGDPPLKWLVIDLMSAYKAGGHQPGFSKTGKKHHGPTLDFLKDCINLLGAPMPTDKALVRRGERILSGEHTFP